MTYQPWRLSRAKGRAACPLRRRRVWPGLSRTFQRSSIDASVRLVPPHEGIGEPIAVVRSRAPFKHTPAATGAASPLAVRNRSP